MTTVANKNEFAKIEHDIHAEPEKTQAVLDAIVERAIAVCQIHPDRHDRILIQGNPPPNQPQPLQLADIGMVPPPPGAAAGAAWVDAENKQALVGKAYTLFADLNQIVFDNPELHAAVNAAGNVDFLDRIRSLVRVCGTAEDDPMKKNTLACAMLGDHLGNVKHGGQLDEKHAVLFQRNQKRLETPMNPQEIMIANYSNTLQEPYNKTFQDACKNAPAAMQGAANAAARLRYAEQAVEFEERRIKQQAKNEDEAAAGFNTETTNKYTDGEWEAYNAECYQRGVNKGLKTMGVRKDFEKKGGWQAGGGGKGGGKKGAWFCKWCNANGNHDPYTCHFNPLNPSCWLTAQEKATAKAANYTDPKIIAAARSRGGAGKGGGGKEAAGGGKKGKKGKGKGKGKGRW
jgi:hypothetical protein